MQATRAYARASQETASKERLMVLLFETALRHMRNAAPLLEEQANAQKLTEALKLLTKANDIVTELAGTLDVQRAPELAASLGELYRYVSERLAHAGVFRDAKAAQDAATAFAPIVEGFQAAVAAMTTQAGK